MELLWLLVLLLTANMVYTKADLFVGTGGFGYGCGSNSPAVQMPYSFVRLGPDTSPLLGKYLEFEHYGGYHSGDEGMLAFSHMHLVGAGVIDMGVLGVLPIPLKKQSPEVPTGKAIPIFKTTQHAEPGYYRIDISGNITAQLTSTQRCGLHRYTFHDVSKKHVIQIMPSYLLQKKAPRNVTISKCGEKCFEGTIFIAGGFGGRFGGYHVSFHFRWAAQKSTVYMYNGTQVSADATVAMGSVAGALITTTGSSFEMAVGLSYVSVANARNNLQRQAGMKNFDTIKAENQQVWHNEFSRFQITAISPEMQTKIDTAIYRTMQSPTLFNDANGEYLSFRNDGSTERVPAGMNAVYTDMSLWDVHRTQMPWLLFQDLERFNDIAGSLVLINQQGGYMPKWPFAQGWTGCMIGAHANTVLADWLVKGAHRTGKANTKEILGYMLRNANQNTPHDSRPNVESYRALGYVAADNEARSAASETLQLSFNDFSISQTALLLSQTSVYADFLSRSKNYRNVWNAQHKFFEPRLQNGTFVKISTLERINIFSNHYVEGNAWHYRFEVPHDVPGLIGLFGGNQAFVKQLEFNFQRSLYWPTKWLPNPYYWAGNEHDLFSVWMFSYANRGDLTGKYSRKILDTQYGTGGDGLPGNDDYATMSAWLIFASLGFYPLPSTETYILGSPAIHSARIFRKMGDGKQTVLNIRVQGNSVTNNLVQSSSINGKTLDSFVSHSDFQPQNSFLIFRMK